MGECNLGGDASLSVLDLGRRRILLQGGRLGAS